MLPENNNPTPSAPAENANGATPPAAEPGVDLKTILDYDPFEAKPGIEPVQEPTAGTETVQPAAAPVQEPTPQAPTLEQFQELQARLTAMEAARQQQQLQPGQQQTQPGQPGTQPQGQQPQRRYGFQVQQQILDGLNSEDPNLRNGSLVTLVNGVSEIIHDTVLAEVRGMIEQMANAVPQQIQQTTQQQAEQQRVFNDFYGTFPELNNPTFHSLVGQIAGQIGAKKPGGWTPALRDEIGREVYKILKWPIPGQRQNVPKPPAQSSPTARPGAPAPVSEQVQDMMDLLTP